MPQQHSEDGDHTVSYIVTIEGDTRLWQKFVGFHEIERTRDRLIPLQFRQEYEGTFRRRRSDQDGSADYYRDCDRLPYRIGAGNIVNDPDDRTAWLIANGYTDPFRNEGQWWAFPPNGVMPVPICEAIAVALNA